MRRDLNRGCAVCRLRYSARLAQCPVCRSAFLEVDDAIRKVQPTSRAAWFAKWVIVLSCIPAIGLVLSTGSILLNEGWPPKSALDIVMYALGAVATCLGASLAVGIPLVLWFGVIAIVRFILKLVVDRPRRSLRVTIETKMRSSTANDNHVMHRLWNRFDDFVAKQAEKPKRVLAISAALFLGVQLIAEIFGETPILNFTSLKDFGSSIVVLGVINGMASLVIPLFWGVFSWFGTVAMNFLRRPPNLFGYDSSPPDLKNEEFLQSITENRPVTIGLVARLNPGEIEALGQSVKENLIAPLSGQTCLGFRIAGDADGQPVDDADATCFALITDDQKRCVVQVLDVVVNLAADAKIRTDSARGFLQERGLREKDLSLKESVLREGDRVRVYGKTSDLRVASASYRGDERRLLIDAGDGLPVVIRGVEEARA